MGTWLDVSIQQTRQHSNAVEPTVALEHITRVPAFPSTPFVESIDSRVLGRLNINVFLHDPEQKGSVVFSCMRRRENCMFQARDNKKRKKRRFSSQQFSNQCCARKRRSFLQKVGSFASKAPKYRWPVLVGYKNNGAHYQSNTLSTREHDDVSSSHHKPYRSLAWLFRSAFFLSPFLS